MLLATVLATTLYFQLQSGESAGLGNTILKPRSTLGIRSEGSLLTQSSWIYNGDARIIVGETLTGTSVSNISPRELHAQGEVLYRYYQEDEETISVGPYFDLALPFHGGTPPYILQRNAATYSAKEDELLHYQHLVGVDLHLDFSGKKLQSSLRNVLFLNGTKIGPNLATYEPLLGFLWKNSYAVIGTVHDPVLTLNISSDFYMAHKKSASLLNGHDGLGGTKRELDIDFGLGWKFMRNTTLTLDMWGTNNLNRGTSNAVPVNFRDGFTVGVEYKF